MSSPSASSDPENLLPHIEALLVAGEHFIRSESDDTIIAGMADTMSSIGVWMQERGDQTGALAEVLYLMSVTAAFRQRPPANPTMN